MLTCSVLLSIGFAMLPACADQDEEPTLEYNLVTTDSIGVAE